MAVAESKLLQRAQKDLEDKLRNTDSDSTESQIEIKMKILDLYKG